MNRQDFFIKLLLEADLSFHYMIITGTSGREISPFQSVYACAAPDATDMLRLSQFAAK